jgi:hypothetical protein
VKCVGNDDTANGLLEMPLPWKSAKSADSHCRLEKSRQNAAPTFSHFHRPYCDLSF